jgi:sialate O-acetylesterase
VCKKVLDPVEANNTPSTIEFYQTTLDGVVSKISITDVLFGDVWLCGGQSNMEWNLYNAFNGSNEIKNAANYTDIRIFQVSRSNNSKPLNDIVDIYTRWSIPSKLNLQKFSAVCWFDSKQLYKQLIIPIGLVQSCYGDTNIEKWLSPEPISFCEVRKSSTNSMHWNSMIKPLHSLSIYGIVWYQGETNRVFNLYLDNFNKLILS